MAGGAGLPGFMPMPAREEGPQGSPNSRIPPLAWPPGKVGRAHPFLSEVIVLPRSLVLSGGISFGPAAKQFSLPFSLSEF